MTAYYPKQLPCPACRAVALRVPLDGEGELDPDGYCRCAACGRAGYTEHWPKDADYEQPE